MLNATVSLDLANAKKDRPDFNKYLADVTWTKLSNVDTVWTIHYPKAEEVNIPKIKTDIANTLLAAAKELKLDRIDFVAQVGNGTAIGRHIIKKNGVYTVSEFNPHKPAVNPA